MSTATFEDELRSLLRDTADAEGPAYVDVDPDVVVTRAVESRAVGGWQRAPGSRPPSWPWGSPARSSAGWGGTVRWSPCRPVTVIGRDGRTTSRPAATLPANPRLATYAEVGGGVGLVVGVMPASAKDVVSAWVPDPVESSLASAQVPGTGRQVFAISHAGAGKSGLAGFDWTDGEQVYTSAGSSVQSARFGEAVGFVDQNQDLLGIFGADGTVSKRLSDTPAGALPALMAGRVPDGSVTMDSTVLVLLPAGATGVGVTPSSGAAVRSVDAVPGGSADRTPVLVRLTEPRPSTGTGVERVRWTNPDGSAGSGTVG